jgi:hypothetical protein
MDTTGTTTARAAARLLFLYGPPGVAKLTVAHELAARRDGPQPWPCSGPSLGCPTRRQARQPGARTTVGHTDHTSERHTVRHRNPVEQRAFLTCPLSSPLLGRQGSLYIRAPGPVRRGLQLRSRVLREPQLAQPRRGGGVDRDRRWQECPIQGALGGRDQCRSIEVVATDERLAITHVAQPIGHGRASAVESGAAGRRDRRLLAQLQRLAAESLDRREKSSELRRPYLDSVLAVTLWTRTYSHVDD